jgi:CRP/FNR family transcriptional regulator, cyclic AMP receptor protein
MNKRGDVAGILELCGSFETVSIGAGDFLFREGDPAHALYIVKKGVLRILRGHTVYETVRSGGIVGEMAIITVGAARSASVIAGTHADLIEVNTERFLSLVSERPDFSLAVMRVMARRLRIMNERFRPGTYQHEVSQEIAVQQKDYA